MRKELGSREARRLARDLIEIERHLGIINGIATVRFEDYAALFRSDSEASLDSIKRSWERWKRLIRVAGFECMDEEDRALDVEPMRMVPLCVDMDRAILWANDLLQQRTKPSEPAELFMDTRFAPAQQDTRPVFVPDVEEPSFDEAEEALTPEDIDDIKSCIKQQAERCRRSIVQRRAALIKSDRQAEELRKTQEATRDHRFRTDRPGRPSFKDPCTICGQPQAAHVRKWHPGPGGRRTFISNPVSDGGRYYFVSSCLQSTFEDIQDMISRQQKISMATFAKKIGQDQWNEIRASLGYDRYLPISRAWNVGYYSSEYRGVPCVFLRWSGVEHIYTLEGKQGESLHTEGS